ncbi:MAG: response regulator, partial [Gemmatimonadales bacterium]
AVRTVLERAGHQVREARSGEDAIRLWNEEESDLVISDIHMPDMDGIETMIELRALRPELPIIAVSGSGNATCRALLLEAKLFGAIRILDKPFQIAELLTCVGELLQNGREDNSTQARSSQASPRRHSRGVASHAPPHE